MKKVIKALEKENYISPDIEIVECVTEQNILANGSTGELPGFSSEDW